MRQKLQEGLHWKQSGNMEKVEWIIFLSGHSHIRLKALI